MSLTTTYFRVVKKSHYATIALFSSEDERLSWKAKGLHVYFISRPDGWEINMTDLLRRSSDGKDCLLSTLRELESFGYIRRERERMENGTFGKTMWEVHEIPDDQGGLSRTGKSTSGLSSAGKPATNNNQVSNNQVEEKTTTTGTTYHDGCGSRLIQKNLGDARYLELNIRGDQVREDEWFLRCILEERRNHNDNCNGLDSVDALLTMFPTYRDRFKRWFLQPLHLRLSAIVYTHIKAQPKEPFKYALALIEKTPEALNDFVGRAKAAIDANDLEVKIA